MFQIYFDERSNPDGNVTVTPQPKKQEHESAFTAEVAAQFGLKGDDETGRGPRSHNLLFIFLKITET